MLESTEISDLIPASPADIYDAWVSTRHGEMTGGAATPGRRMVMAWRPTEFPDGATDSHLEVLLDPAPGGTQVTFRHTQIPQGQAESYRRGAGCVLVSPP